MTVRLTLQPLCGLNTGVNPLAVPVSPPDELFSDRSGTYSRLKEEEQLLIVGEWKLFDYRLLLAVLARGSLSISLEDCLLSGSKGNTGIEGMRLVSRVDSFSEVTMMDCAMVVLPSVTDASTPRGSMISGHADQEG